MYTREAMRNISGHVSSKNFRSHALYAILKNSKEQETVFLEFASVLLDGNPDGIEGGGMLEAFFARYNRSTNAYDSLLIQGCSSFSSITM